jgi:hypothetical protein
LKDLTKRIKIKDFNHNLNIENVFLIEIESNKNFNQIVNFRNGNGTVYQNT